jgi:hypothetical protein
VDSALIGAIVGACVAGGLTIVASVATVVVADRRAKYSRHREAHLAAAAEVLSALQNLNRKMINVAREGRPAKADADNVFWDDFHETATRWNSARYVAALYCSQEEFDILTELDAETDMLLELAMSKVWTSREFRPHRQHLGVLAASFLREARAASGQPSISIPSVWAWDRNPSPAYLPPGPSRAQP